MEWYAVSTRSRHEKKVFQNLVVRDFETFLPLYQSLRRWRNGIQAEVELPLFQGYVFVRLNLRDRVRVLEVPGLVNIVSTGNTPAPLPDTEIDILRRGIADLRAEPHPFLKVGDQVRVKNGALTGVVGRLLQKKSRTMLVISVDLLMQAVAVDINEADVEPVLPTSLQGVITPAAVRNDQKPYLIRSSTH